MAAQSWELLRDPTLARAQMLSWDEYPFASSNEGGQPGVTIWPFPLHENSLKEGIVIGSYIVERIRVMEDFAVVVIPDL